LCCAYYGKHGLVEMTYESRVAEMGKTREMNPAAASPDEKF